MKGVTSYRIPEGQPGAGIKVVKIHYAAIPDWTPERVAKEKARYPNVALWNREMEIDERARRGDLVFPEYSDTVHIVKPDLPLEPGDINSWLHNWTVYMGCDPHPRRAHAMVWLAVNRYGEKVVPWSWWPQAEMEERIRLNEEAGGEKGKGRFTIEEYATDWILPLEKGSGYLSPYGRVMDMAGRNFDADEDENYFKRYAKHGVHYFTAKKNIGLAGYDRITADLHLRQTDSGKLRPNLTFYAGCGHNDILCEQLRTWHWQELRGNMDKDAPEKPEDKAHDLIDALSYIELADPVFVDQFRREENPWEPIYPAIGY